MTLHHQMTALQPIVPRARRAVVSAHAAAAARAAALDYAACRHREAAYLARVEAGGLEAVARAAVKYPFAAGFRIPAAGYDIIREAMEDSVPDTLRPRHFAARGHEEGVNPDPDLLARAVTMSAEGAQAQAIAASLGLSPSTVWRYLRFARRHGLGPRDASADQTMTTKRNA